MKRRIYLLSLLILFVLSACGTNGTLSIENGEIEQNGDGVTTEEVFLDLEKYSLENEGTTYGQPEFISNRAASSDLGIYYWGGNENSRERLMFYDKASKVSVLLCNRPNCTHSDNTCNASFNAYTLYGEEFYRYMIYFYDNSVFLVGHDEEHYVNLYRVAPDGSNWEKYMSLFKVDMTIATENGGMTGSWSLPQVCIHQNYIYYIDENESYPKLRRIQLGGTEVEVIYEPVGERTVMSRIRGYGDFLFFQASSYTGNELTSGGIYAYNTKTDEVSLIKEKVILEYAVVDEILYYVQNEKLYKYNLKNGESKELPILLPVDADIRFFADKYGIYLFHSDSGSLEVYDESGTSIGSVGDGQISSCYFGKDGIFYGQVGDGSGRSAILEIEDVLNGNGKWLYIK